MLGLIVFHCNVKELFWQYKLGTFLPNDLNEMATDVELDTFACGGGLIPAIEFGVSGGSVGSALLSSYLTECFFHLTLRCNSLSSHSRFSILRIIERPYGRAVGLLAGPLRCLLYDLLDAPE